MAVDKLIYCRERLEQMRQDIHALEEIKDASPTALELELPITSVHISGRSVGIGMRSGMIVGSVSLRLDATITVTLDATSEPSRGECGAPVSERLSKCQPMFSGQD